MRLALWSPRPDDGWVEALARFAAREGDLEILDREPPRGPDADLDIYHVADDPAHGFAYRALLQKPGLVVLEDWGLHRLVHAETAGRGDPEAYRREAYRAHGETGLFVARQVLKGQGGRLPTLVPLNQRVLEAALGIVATTEAVRALAAARLSELPVVHVPLAFLGTRTIPDPRSARAALGLSPESPAVVAVHPAGTSVEEAEHLARALDDVRVRAPGAAVLSTSEDDAALESILAAGDVVVALEDPVRTGLGRAVPLAVGAGRPTLVTAGSGAAREIPDGVVAHVSPGTTGPDEASAIVLRLLVDEPLRVRMGRLATTFAAERRLPTRSLRVLLDLARRVERGRDGAMRELEARRAGEDRVSARALETLRPAAREVGLARLPLGVEPLIVRLFEDETR